MRYACGTHYKSSKLELQGNGNPRPVRVFGDLLKSHNPNLVFLSETLVETKVIKEIAVKVGFANSFEVDCIGRGGGLALMWKHSFVCQVLDSSSNHINMHIMDGLSISWKLTCFYGYPERTRRQASWDFLRSLSNNVNIPWCIFGDFNDMLYVEDKKGAHLHP